MGGKGGGVVFCCLPPPPPPPSLVPPFLFPPPASGRNSASISRLISDPPFQTMFESLKSTIQDLLNGRVAPGDRRAAIYEMKRALVSAKLGVEDLREGVEITRRKLAGERDQLATVQRRKTLAEGINDAETVALAVKYEQQH